MNPASDQPESSRLNVLNVAAKALQAGDFVKAAAVLRPLLEKDADNAAAWRLLGLARFGSGEHLEGMNQVRRAITLEPNNAAPHRDLGAIFIQMERFAEAVDAYRSALALDRLSAEAWNGFGAAVWRMDGGLDDAIEAFRTASALKGDYAEAYNNLGTSLRDREDFNEAIVACRKALDLKSPAPITAHNLAMALLSAGRWEEAWPLFEDRLEVPGCISKSIGDVNLSWDGTPMPEGRLLVVFEQGMGDTIQFIRYLPQVRKRCARLGLLCQPSLRTLLAGTAGVDELVERADAFPHEAAVALMSLPGLFGTTPDTIQGDGDANVAPYVNADQATVSQWRKRLDPQRMHVGLCWSGNPNNATDRHRSLPLAHFAALAGMPNVVFHSLQFGHGSDAAADPPPGLELIDWSDELGDFANTAALVENLDLVIACDTAIIHLAGAMGRPVWTLLSAAADWRWLPEGDDTQWYPTMRLFRQSTPGDWTTVMERVQAALVDRVAQNGGVEPVAVREQAVRARLAAQGAAVSGRAAGGENAAPRSGMELDSNSPYRLRKCRHGWMLYNVNDQYIGRSFEQYGEFSEKECEVFCQLLRPDQCVLDVGANIGAHTILFARAVGPKGRVLAFEPQRLIFQMLCANVACNGLWHVDCCQAAAGSQPGRIQVPQLNPTVRQNFGGLGLDNPQRGEGAAVITIDGLNLPRCHFMKIDVEGMEANVLEGARKTIETHKPILYVEHDREAQQSPVTALLRDLNYTLYVHRPPLFNPRNFARHDINVFGPVRSQNLLCIHQSRDQRIEGLPRVEG